MPHPPQLSGSFDGFTHLPPQQSRAAPQAASHPALPELPPPELVLPELLLPELPLEPPEPPLLEAAPLDAPLLDAPLLEAPLLEAPLLEAPLPELLPAPSMDASSPGCTTNVEPPQCKPATTSPTSPIGK
jgi:hypothetical protein